MKRISVVSADTLLVRPLPQKEVWVTHDGPRHADETLALARVAALRGDLEVCFSRDKRLFAPDKAFPLVDVGGEHDPARRRWDHHFRPVPARPDGLPLSSFGLMSPEDEVNHPLVRHVDAVDNGVRGAAPLPVWWPNMAPGGDGGSVGWCVARANPVNLDGQEVTDDQFAARGAELIQLFSQLFSSEGRLLPPDAAEAKASAIQEQLRVWHAEHEAAYAASLERVKAATSEPALVKVFSQFEVACFDWLAGNTETLFVVFPGPGRRQWMCRQVPVAPGRLEGRKALPQAWAGKAGSVLADLTGVADAVFCHANAFICGAASQAGAEALAWKAVEA
jgi:uncharacterized UPF0160 family protein